MCYGGDEKSYPYGQLDHHIAAVTVRQNAAPTGRRMWGVQGVGQADQAVLPWLDEGGRGELTQSSRARKAVRGGEK
ncbi:hypothetical protein GOP47_0010526 [Adiantum capillus-veneris]|uniref:Uncharacterized protein n=1 Tax=Adiantum capillus-veneris TaxID=13818 RepID=A0A9D4UUU3_ADICA|nr:hypothetical protein GOP47_0010526 [Adiantum capillus-veneris]